MKKSKKIICSILFGIILEALLIATYFIKSEQLSMFDVIAPWICGTWVYDQVMKFYKWLDK